MVSHMLKHGYLAQTLRRPLPTKDGGPCAPWPTRPIILSHYRKFGVGPIGTALFNSSWIWGTIRDQPPARTRPVLRSAAQSQNAHPKIVISRNSGGDRWATRTSATAFWRRRRGARAGSIMSSITSGLPSARYRVFLNTIRAPIAHASGVRGVSAPTTGTLVVENQDV